MIWLHCGIFSIDSLKKGVVFHLITQLLRTKSKTEALIPFFDFSTKNNYKFYTVLTLQSIPK